MIDNPDNILFITGGCGFIGSNFINYIMKEYNSITLINFDAMYYCASESNIDEDIQNLDRYKLIKGNLQNKGLLDHIFQNNKITHIIHYAAQSHVDNSFSTPLQYTIDNILGTHNLLECTRKYCKTLKLFIHVSTDEVYGESLLNESSKTELSVLCPTNPYAASKAGAELIANSYLCSFKMPIIITRGNNVYGPNQYPEKLIPKFIKLLKENKQVTIHGDGSSLRAFIYVDDVSSAFKTLLNKGKIGEIYNIGCDNEMEYSVIDVAKLLIQRIHNTNDYDKWITYIDDRPFNDKRYYISNKKIKELGWDIKVNFTEGINILI